MEFPPYVRDLNGTLHFDNVSMTDRGRYTCIATSTQGTINASVDVDVIGKSFSFIYYRAIKIINA